MLRLIIQMLQNTSFLQATPSKIHTPSHSKTSSTSSPKSRSPNPEVQKAKAELCRRFMQLGMCPYQRRCKFAHGSHQLLTNNQRNIKYKTKLCGNFQKNFNCMYGDRCNFIHAKEPRTFVRPSDPELAILQGEGRAKSRLLGLLQFVL